MAFGVEELRVLRRALALALHPTSASAEDVQDCLRLADSLDEATRESARLRAFLVADLGRYRAALPGTAAGYLTLLEEALGAGYRPVPDDLAALRALRGNPTAAALLHRCECLAEQDVRSRLASRSVPAPATPAEQTAPATTPETTPAAPAIPASRRRTRTGTGTGTRSRTTVPHLLALPGGQSASHPAADTVPAAAQGDEKPEQPTRKPTPSQPQRPKTQPKPATPAAPQGPGSAPRRNRPIPTPGEVFPRRKPTPPPPPPDQRLAAG